MKVWRVTTPQGVGFIIADANTPTTYLHPAALRELLLPSR